MTRIGPTEALVPGHLLGGVPELGIAADVEIPRAGLMTSVLNAWGLAYPLRFAVQVLLAFGGQRDPRLALEVTLFFIALAEAIGPVGERRDSDVQATAVAHMFGLSPHLRAALIYLRWAALAGTTDEQNNHLDGAIEHIKAVIAGMEQIPSAPSAIDDSADCEDQALAPTAVCLNWQCEEWFNWMDGPIRPPLVLRGKFWCCPKCGASYGEHAKEGLETTQQQGAGA